uniref:Uncharacterized protein n=1 Tax=viral metagenome TaxID=1070528 RepID=A0A6C0HST1_9ZZZZ
MSENKLNYAAIAKKEEVKVDEEVEDMLLLKFVDGEVVYSMKKSEDLLQKEAKELEKKKGNTIGVQMNKAIDDIVRRKNEHRTKILNDYGYDSYTNEFYYEPESTDSSDEETL